jgi:hypothetical protein
MRNTATAAVDFLLTKFFNVQGLIHYNRNCSSVLSPIVRTYENTGALSQQTTPDAAVQEVLRRHLPDFQNLTAQVEKDIVTSRAICGGGSYSGSGAHVYYQWQIKPRSTNVDAAKVNFSVAPFFPGNKNFGASPVVSSYANGAPMELLLGSGDQVFVLNSRPYSFKTSAGTGLGYVFRTGRHALDGILFHGNTQTSSGHDIIVRIGLGHRHFLPGSSLSFPDRINSPAGIGLWSLADLLHDYTRLGHVGMVKAYGIKTADTVRHIYAAMAPRYGLGTLLGEIGMDGWQTRGKSYMLKQFVSVGGGASRALQPVAKMTYRHPAFIYAFGVSMIAYAIYKSVYGYEQDKDSSQKKIE